MRVARNVALGAFAVAVIAGLVVGSEPQGASAIGADSGCVVTDASGTQLWVGGPSAEMTALGDALEAITDAHPAHATGVAFCSHYEGVQVYLPSGDDAVQALVTQAAAEHPDYSVQIVRVPNSLQTLLDAASVVASAPTLAGIVVGVGPDVANGGLGIIVNSASGVAISDAASLVSRVLGASGRDIPLTFSSGSPMQFASAASAETAPISQVRQQGFARFF